MSNAALVQTGACPVCGGIEREPSEGMATSGFHYLKHAAGPLGVSVQELISRAKAYQCSSCHSYFCDPWLSPELASQLFCAGAPDHNAGWSTFEGWLRNQYSLRDRNDRLYAAVTSRTGSIATYAEFGCPFQGFLLQFRGYETEPPTRVQLLARALARTPDVRWSRTARLYHAMHRLSIGLVVLALRLRARLDSLVGHGSSSNGHSALPARRYLLTQDTTKGWGSNCVRYGATCQYFAHAVLGADVIPMEEAHRGKFATFDVIGVFNSLDHMSFPVEALRKLIAMTKHVLLVTHDAKHAGKQHLYAFDESFASWLRESIAGLVVEDLRDEMALDERDYNYLLLTKGPEFSDANHR